MQGDDLSSEEPSPNDVQFLEERLYEFNRDATGINDATQFDPGIMERSPGGHAPGYVEFNTPYAGMPQVIRPDGLYASQQRFGLYRWHIMDPIRFTRDLRVTIQALGWRTHKDRQYLPLQDDIASVAFWYQSLPTSPFPVLPDRDYLEVI